MIYYLDGSVLDKNQLKEEDILGKSPCIGVLDKAELEEWNPYLGIIDTIVDECLTGQTSKFESHEGFDYIALQIPNKSDLERKESRISIYYRQNLLIFICEKACEYTILAGIIAKVEMKEIKNLTLERVLYEFFDQLTAQDSLYIETLEQEITDLEESLITSMKKDYIQEIISLRKRLLILKRYYEQLLDIAEAMEENENELITKNMARYFRLLTNRTQRLSNSISNLRDYVSQVREAYQAEVEISQNDIMKFFTVITSIFLPLTLIVGWYGMNFPMPEYKWAYGYPVVIIVSVTVALFSLYYFKKNKWF